MVLLVRDASLSETMSRNLRDEIAAVFIMIRAMPHTEWLPEAIRRDRWGYLLTCEDAAAERSHGDRRALTIGRCGAPPAPFPLHPHPDEP